MGWSAPGAGAAGARLIGVDVARGLAVLGMFAAHLGVPRELVLQDPGTWGAIVHGRSSVLFALLAGVSLALVSGRTTPVTGRALATVRGRTAVRAVLLFALGVGLSALDTPIAVILQYYAVLFLLCLPLLAWPARRLFVTAGVLALVTPVLRAYLVQGLGDPDSLGVSPGTLLVTGSYPVLVWITYAVAGLGVGRLDLTARRVHLGLLGSGAALAALGYTAGRRAWLAAASGTWPDDARGRAPWYLDLATADPHTDTVFEVLGSGGFALAVAGLCLLVAAPARFAVLPLAAVGSMSLTVYSVHIVAYRLMADRIDADALGALPWFVLAALVGATAWRLTLGKGPLERLTGWVARTVWRP